VVEPFELGNQPAGVGLVVAAGEPVCAANLAPADVDTAVTRLTTLALSPALSVPTRCAGPGGRTARAVSIGRVQRLHRRGRPAIYLAGGAGRHRSDGRPAGRSGRGGAGAAGDRGQRPEAHPRSGQLGRDLVGSSARLQLAIAPAGAGKTTALAALVGDFQQLASVAAGGVLAEIAATHGAVTLTPLVRFADPAEAAATVALRDGDTTALGFYLDSGRVHIGDLATCAEQAYAAWAADRAHGADALLLAATREVVQQLNQRARADRLAALGELAGREVALADGTRAGTGDPIITRANQRQLPITVTDWVKNGDRWTVRAVRGHRGEGDDAARIAVPDGGQVQVVALRPRVRAT
jgi:hypothetical protein